MAESFRSERLFCAQLDPLFVRLIPAICVFAFALAGCGKSHSPSAATNIPAARQSPLIDACALLNDADVESVQQSPVKDRKSAANSSGGLRTSQCFYATAESNRSVSLSVTQTDATSGALGVNAYWEQTFGRYENGADENARSDEADEQKKKSLLEKEKRPGEEEGAAPTKVADIGDQAFWASNRVGGALYVLKKEKSVFLRISVGGPDSAETKLEKSKKLAAKALQRL